MAKKQSFDAQMLVKHHYWILAGLGGIALPIFWYLASGSLAEVFDAGKKAREDVRKKVEGFQAAQQPNEEINKVATTRHGEQNEEVYKAWKFQYERQQPCMHWNLPAIGDMWDPWLLNGVDSEGEPVTGLASESEQIALENARTKGTELNQQVRILYGSWLNDALALPKSYDLTDERTLQFRRLYLLIDLRRPIIMRVDEKELAKPKAKEQKKGLLDELGTKKEKEPGDRIAGTQYTGRVSWTESERTYLEHKFGHSEVWRRNPSTAQVIYTQESMNVYAMLLYYIVAKTNRDQAEHQFLAIKQIITMRLGEDCQLPSKDGAAPGGAAGGAGGPGAGGPGAGGPGAGGAGAGGAGVGVGGGNSLQDPWAPFVVGPLSGGGGSGGGGGGPGGVRPGDGMSAVGGGGNLQGQGGGPTDGANRYVDYEGFSLPNPKSGPAEYRMLPVVMRLVMDYRMLPEVQACCVESPLPIKITQLNLREPGSTESTTVSGGGGGGFGPGAGGGFGPGGGAPGAPGAGGFGGAGPGAGGVGAGAGSRAAGGVGRRENPIRADGFGGEIELGPYDREVEIKGVIYLCNLPDRTKVGKGADAADVPAAAPVVPEAKQPAGTPEKTPAVEPSAKTPEAKIPNGKTPPSGEGLKAAAENSAAKAVTEKTGGAAKAPEKAPDPSKEPAPKPAPPAVPPEAGAGAKTPAGKS